MTNYTLNKNDLAKIFVSGLRFQEILTKFEIRRNRIIKYLSKRLSTGNGYRLTGSGRKPIQSEIFLANELPLIVKNHIKTLVADHKNYTVKYKPLSEINLSDYF